jgi:hypothetical protein
MHSAFRIPLHAPHVAAPHVAAILVAFCAAGANAQTCESPIPLTANSTRNFNTCTATNSLPFHYFEGALGFPSPSPDIVFMFDEPGRSPPPGMPQPLPRPRTLAVTVQPHTFAFPAQVVLLKAQCDALQFPAAVAGSNGNLVQLPDSSFHAGQRYYVVVTGFLHGPSTCGGFTILRSELGALPRG